MRQAYDYCINSGVGAFVRQLAVLPIVSVHRDGLLKRLPAICDDVEGKCMNARPDPSFNDSLNQGLALGVERFKDDIEAIVARSVRAGKPGRRRAKEMSGLLGKQTDLLFKE